MPPKPNENDTDRLGQQVKVLTNTLNPIKAGKQVLSYGESVAYNFWNAWRHTKMYTLVSAIVVLLYLLCLFSNNIIISWDTCNEAHFSLTIGCREHTKSCGVDEECRYYYRAGLFQADWGEGVQAVCNGVFPPPDNATGQEPLMCKPLKASRSLFIVSAILAVFSLIVGVVYNWKYKVENPADIPSWMRAQIVLQLAAAVLSCIGFGVFQDQVMEDYKIELQKAVMITSPNVLDSSYYSTLGYTFGLFVCVWVWPFTVLGTKTFFNHLDIHEIDVHDKVRVGEEDTLSTFASTRL